MTFIKEYFGVASSMSSALNEASEYPSPLCKSDFLPLPSSEGRSNFCSVLFSDLNESEVRTRPRLSPSLQVFVVVFLIPRSERRRKQRVSGATTVRPEAAEAPIRICGFGDIIKPRGSGGQEAKVGKVARQMLLHASSLEPSVSIPGTRTLLAPSTITAAESTFK